MSAWPEIRNSGWLKNFLKNKNYVSYWKKIFERTYLGKIDTWDYQWLFSCWVQNQLCIMPNVNLVSNIGFGSEAVHTNKKNRFSEMKTDTIEFPLKIPGEVIQYIEADEYTEEIWYSKNGFINRVLDFIINKLRIND